MAGERRQGDAGRMRKAREIWVGIIQQYERSGLTQEAFADERGIPVGTIRSWIYKLRREREEAPVLPVRVIASPAPTARRPDEEVSAIEVDVGDVVRVRLPSSTPPAAVAELVALLRARC
jgi:transposase-like protein